MTVPKHDPAMDALALAARLLTPHADQFAGLIRAEQEMHSILHITDPTLYMKAIRSDSLRWQVELSEAALAFIRAVQKVKEEIAGGET